MSDEKIATLSEIESMPEFQNRSLDSFKNLKAIDYNLPMEDVRRQFNVTPETIKMWAERPEDTWFTRQAKGLWAGVARTGQQIQDLGQKFANYNTRHLFASADEEQAERLIALGMRQSANRAKYRASHEQYEGTDDSMAAKISGAFASALEYAAIGGAGFLVGGPAGASAAVGVASGLQEGIETSEQFAQKYIEETGDYALKGYDKSNDAIAMGYGAISGFIESALGIEAVLAGSMKKAGFNVATRRLLLGGVEEGAEEFLQTLAGGVAGKITGLDDRTWDDIAKDALEGAAYGALVGGTLGTTMYYYHRNRLSKRLQDRYGLTPSEANIVANSAIDETASQTEKEASTVVALQDHFGTAFDSLVGKVESTLDAAGWDTTQVDPKTNQPYDVHEYAKTVATDIAFQVLRQAKINQVPVNEVLDLAEIESIDNVLYLKPQKLGTKTDIENTIKEKKAQVKRLTELAKTGAGDPQRKATLKTQIAVLDKLLDRKNAQQKAREDARPQELKDRSNLAKKDVKTLQKSNNVMDFAQKTSTPEKQVNPVEAQKRYNDAKLMWLCDGNEDLFASLTEIGSTGTKVVSGINNVIDNVYQFAKDNPDLNLRQDIQGALERLVKIANGANFAEIVSNPSETDVFGQNALLYAFNFGSTEDITTFLNNFMDKANTNKQDGKFKSGTFDKNDLYSQCLEMFDSAFTDGVATDPNMRAVMLSKESEKTGRATLFQEENEKELVVTHGTTLSKLKDALELGALPVPSLAISKANQVSKQYGEITFVGGKYMINKEPVYTSDIYSARRVKPDILINDAGEKYIRSLVGSHASFVIGNLDPNYGNYQDALMHLYLLEKGLRYDPENILRREGADFTQEFSKMSNSEQKEFTQWQENFEKKYFDKKIWAGYTPSGKQKYMDYTLENIVKLMAKKPTAGSEAGFGTSPHALKGVWAKPLKSIEAIRKNKDRLVSKEEYEKVDAQFWDSINKLTDLLRTDELVKQLPYSFEEHIITTLMEIKDNTDIKSLLQQNYMNYSDEAVQAVKDFKTFAESVPTKYFEAKPKRAVNFNEFNGVVMPTNPDYDVVAKKLADMGLQVERTDDLQQGIQNIEAETPVLFQGTKKQGAYDPELQVIIIGKDFNTGTLPHEMAHFWLDDIFRRATTQNDWTPEFAEQANTLFGILGVEQGQTSLTVEQQEKFARMVENVVFGLQSAPDGAVLPTLAYLNWVPEKYKSVIDIRYKGQDGAFHYPLLDKQSADFFNAWYSNANLPGLGASPLDRQNENFTDKNGETVPSTPEIMKLRENEQQKAVDDQTKVDDEIHNIGMENTATDTQAAITGYNTDVARNATTPEPSVQPQEKKKSILRIGRGTNTRAEMIEEAQKYIEKHKEHAEEIAFGDPELVENDSGIERGILIREVMNNYNKGSQEYATLYDNLARTMSLAGKTGGLNNDIQVRFYLDGYSRLNRAMEAKAAAKYAGSNRGAITKFNQDIQKFILSKADAILATEPNSKERNNLIDAMIREAEIKFAGGTGDARMLFQENNFGQKAKRQNKADFLKWADKEIKKMLKANPESDPDAISKLITLSEKAQVARIQLDSTDTNEKVAAAQVLREWQAYTDSLDDTVLDNQISKLNRVFRKIVGSWQPFAMLTNINTHANNMVSNSVNLGAVQGALYAQYGKSEVSKDLIKAESDRIWAVYNATQLDISQMVNPATPSLLHGEKIDINTEKKSWARRNLDTRVWLGKEDLFFRSKVYLSTLAHIATQNAKASGKTANELFQEYCKLNQEAGSEAEQARQQAVLMGNIATFTQNGKLSGMLQKIRTEINKLTDPTGKAGFGTMLAPFLKTPANIVELGVRATFAPITDIKALIKGDWKIQDTLNTIYFVLALAVASALKDYEPEYESGKKYDPTKPYDSITFGSGAWFKLDLFGAMETPIRFLASLKTNKGLGISGVVNATPLIGDVAESVSNVERASKSGEKLLNFGINYAYNQVNKSVPAILKQTMNLANLTNANLQDIDIGIKTGIGRKLGRQYGLDAQDRTDTELLNDVLSLFFNRLKLTEQ